MCVRSVAAGHVGSYSTFFDFLPSYLFVRIAYLASSCASDHRASRCVIRLVCCSADICKFAVFCTDYRRSRLFIAVYHGHPCCHMGSTSCGYSAAVQFRTQVALSRVWPLGPLSASLPVVLLSSYTPVPLLPTGFTDLLLHLSTSLCQF
jgi:hypothetical protein